MNMTAAIEAGRLVAEVAIEIWHAIHEGKPERVEALLPSELRSEIAKRVADVKAERKFGVTP